MAKKSTAPKTVLLTFPAEVEVPVPVAAWEKFKATEAHLAGEAFKGAVSRLLTIGTVAPGSLGKIVILPKRDDPWVAGPDGVVYSE